MSKTTITLPKRKVVRGDDNQYRVYEMKVDGWMPVSKPYGHSTSAFAALGRLTQKDTANGEQPQGKRR